MLKDNLFLVSLGVLIFIVLAVLGIIVYFAMRRSGVKPSADPMAVKLRFDSLRSSFRQAVELIEGNIVSRGERYSIPWVLVLNEGSDQRQLPIEQAGVASALSSEAASAATTQGISWHFFDKGIVVDIQGAYLGSPDDEGVSEKPWDEFLGLCRKYRPQRPFDSVVVTVPVALLLNNGSDSALELERLARVAHRRLWLAQNRFAMRFAVYVVVSGCDQIEGFSPFARALPESMRAGILGWSSPFDLSTTYQDEWVGDAMDSIVRTVADTSAEMFALDSASTDSNRFFLLPSRIEAVREQLKSYIDELMRPSAYHEPFFFRGIYLTGDCSESAQKAVAIGSVDGERDVDSISDQVDLVSDLMREPAFLRDLFEKKIFMEYGLTRPSRQQLTRPLLGRLARWGAVLIFGVWSLGLLVATVQLSKRNPDLIKILSQIEADTTYRSRATALGEAIPSQWYRAKTLALLNAIEGLVTDRAWTFFMPGSWDIFETLDDRVTERIEREFGDVAIGTVRRELYARAAEMTGVSQDESTSELIIGGECAVPEGFSTIASSPRRVGLAVEDLPEFAAILQYLAGVEQLDQAIVAMVRLQKPNQDESKDLRLLIKYTLGADLPSNISKSILYFRGHDGSSNTSPAAVSITHIQSAVRCTMGKGIRALNQRLFFNNDLIVSERLLQMKRNQMFAPDATIGSFSETIEGYKTVLGAIKEQESLVNTGKGGWMRLSVLNLGPAYDAMLARVTQSRRLLGRTVSDQLLGDSAAAFQGFSSDFADHFGPQANPGIIWQDKDARFSLSADRLSLRDALSSLLGQPFMSQPADRDMPEIPSQSVLVWDNAKLDQALALGDVYKRFMGDGLAKFPVGIQDGIGDFIDSHFAQLVNDKVIEALSVSGRTEPTTVADVKDFDSARTKILKIHDFLAARGATYFADDLMTLVSQDAMSRLRQLDRILNQSELYAIRAQDLARWTGERGVLLQAFGVNDLPGLQQYLATQFARAEALGRQSEVYLASLGNSTSDTQLVRRWQSINQELDRYRLKNPNGSLVIYEQFLLSLGSDIDRSNCSEKLTGKGPGSRSTDYFSERYVQVYTAVRSRCDDIRFRDQLEQAEVFSSSFNRWLAGRQPFSMLDSRDAIDADFVDVGEVFKDYDKASSAFKDIPANGKNALAGQSVRRFLEQFERVKGFMAPLYPVEEGAVAGYDLAVEFRVNKSAEIEGNKFIDWTMVVGAQTLKLRDPARPLRWEPGMPITLTLRLAKDSVASLLPDPTQPELTTEGKAITYRFSDTWSLFRMIQRHRQPDGIGRSEGRSQLLRMEFPLDMNADGNKALAQEARGRVFLRITVSPAGKRTPLIWPVIFPTRAPELSKQ